MHKRQVKYSPKVITELVPSSILNLDWGQYSRVRVRQINGIMVFPPPQQQNTCWNTCNNILLGEKQENKNKTPPPKNKTNKLYLSKSHYIMRHLKCLPVLEHLETYGMLKNFFHICCHNSKRWLVSVGLMSVVILYVNQLTSFKFSLQPNCLIYIS